MTRHYRRCAGLAIWDADGGWRLAFVDGQPVTYMPARDAPDLQTAHALDEEMLTALAADGRVLADAFRQEAQLT